MPKMPKGLVYGHVKEAMRLAMYYSATAEQHFRSAILDSYSMQIADNLEQSRGILAHALKLLREHEEAESIVERPTEHEA